MRIPLFVLLVMKLIFCFYSVTAAIAFTAALLGVWTANAGFSTFFCFAEIPHNATYNTQQNDNNDNILHSLFAYGISFFVRAVQSVFGFHFCSRLAATAAKQSR